MLLKWCVVCGEHVSCVLVIAGTCNKEYLLGGLGWVRSGKDTVGEC